MGQLGFGDGLALDPQGVPAEPVTTIHLDEWADATESAVRAATAAVTADPRVSVGLATADPGPTVQPLLEALTLTIGPPGLPDRAELVRAEDPAAALTELLDAVRAHPQAAVAVGQLLGQTGRLPAYSGLAAEAAVYSMLLGGVEFRSWLHERGEKPPRRPRPDPLVRIQRDGGHLAVTLADPDRRNAFSVALREELYAALELALLDDTVEHVTLRGDGPAFCSGGDLTEFGTATDLVAAYLVRLDRGPWRLLEQLRSRTTVHLHGAAVGAGLELAAFADHVVCAPGTRMWLPELAMGLVPGAGGTVSVARRIGRWRAAWMALTGSHVDAETALAWGLVDQIDG